MPTLNINGKRVKVDDSFLQLTPEEQQSQVEGIVAQMASGQTRSAPLPGSREYADWAAAEVRAGRKVPQVSVMPPEYEADRSIPSKIAAATSAAVNAVPIAGPTLLKGLEGARAAVWGMTPEQVAEETKRVEAANPTASTLGSVVGTVAPYVAAAGLPVAATILGVDVAAPLAINMIAGAASQKGIGYLDALVRGDTPEEAEAASDTAGLYGLAGPVVGKAVGKTAEVVGNKVVNPVVKTVRGWVNPEDAAQKIISKTAAADIKAGQVMTPAEMAAAQADGAPLINADMFGPTTRALARTSANTSPEAQGLLSETVQDRFLTQNQRAADWVTRNTGAPTDAYAVQQTITNAAKGVNNAAYKIAYSQPAAEAIWTPEIEQLMQSENFRGAIKAAVKTSNEEAALQGSKPLRDPFVTDPKTKSMRLRMMSDEAQVNLKKALASGDENSIRAARDILKDALANDAPVALPSLEFWDHVQRALRRKAAQIGKSGELDFDAGQVLRARAALNNVLDTTVPEFAQARGGAARWFNAEDALEAGQKFVSTKVNDMAEARAAFNKFTPTEKKLFASGFASSLLGKIGQTGDNVNVINKIFASPQARAQVEMAMGPKAAAELESFLRVENIMQMTKTAVQGGSNTTAQMQAMKQFLGQTAGSAGTGYGAGVLVGGIDPRNWDPKAWTVAGVFGLGKRGAAALGKKVDQRVMQEVARLLTSSDPQLIQQAIKNASRSAASADALRAIENGINLAVHGAGAAAVAPPQTVH
jgi:hypothetical protein